MDTTIYYFTGTGNSLYIAREIARHLPGETTLVPIPALTNRGGEMRAPPGRVGFAFPVYAGGPPLMVADFAGRIDLSAAERTFAVVTMGSAGDAAYWRLKEILEDRGYTLDAAYTVAMPNNYILLSDVYPEVQEQKVIAAGKKEAEMIAADIAAENRTFTKGPRALNFATGLLYPFFAREARRHAKKFYADDKCNGCGTCEEVCPTKNISGAGMRPVWGSNCEACMACIHFCPRNAIQWGRKTAAKGRYHHPEVSVDDMMVQSGRATAREDGRKSAP